MILFALTRAKTIFWTIFYRAIGRFAFAEIGKGCRFEGWIDIPQRGGQIRLGQGVVIGRMVELSVTQGAELVIGNHSFIGRGVLINAQDRVQIGNDVLIAEFAALHDNNHRYDDLSQPMSQQGTYTQPITIGDDVWIGAQAMLLAGATVPSGCVIGAKTLVTNSTQAKPRAVIVGTPGQTVKIR